MPKRLLTMEEENALLRKENKKLKTAAARKNKLIARPKGQAGKGSGYNLRRKMCLRHDKARYNRLSMCHPLFLETGKTISQQVPATLAKVIIQKNLKYFQRFKAGWLILAADPDVWADSSDDEEGSGSDENAVELAAESDDGNDVAAQDNDTDESEPTEDIDFDINLILDGTKPLAEEAELFPSTPVKSMKEQKKQKENVAPPKSPIVKPRPRQKREVPEGPMSPSPQKRKISHKGNEEMLRKTKKRKLESDADTSSDATSITLRPITRAEIPNVCPSPYCKTLIPQDLSPTIMHLFAQKRQLIHEHGPTAPGCWELIEQICQALGKDAERGRCLVKAKDAGWPTTIDFDALPDRVSRVLPELRALQRDSDLLLVSPVWNKFLERIDFKVFAFSRSSAKFATANLGVGYFGPKGYAVILAALKSTKNRAWQDKDETANDLYPTLAELTDIPEDWDEFDDASNLISTNEFVKFILIPHVAATLISQDLQISLQDAVTVLEDSAVYGNLFNGDLPENVDHVIPSDIRSFQLLPRQRKAVKLVLPPQKTVTLDDFASPVAKEKKPKKEKLKSQVKSPKKKKERVDKKLDPHKYGTRSSTKCHLAVAVVFFFLHLGSLLEKN
ncbi:hypothetical protein B0H13DRAFT_2310560 [Mycena leptocephala]|nr:hypothetical protein B0H13DRAFT_2310560 [Mycena leptocephala]